MSNKTKLIAILLLSIPVLLFSMENPGKSELEEHPASSLFYGTSIKEMEEVFEDAPKEAKDIVRHLKDPSFLGAGGCRATFLIGNPGVGKTTLAKAIAYKAGWDYAYMTCADVLGQYRNETAIKLRDTLGQIVSRNVETVAIIDEINRLLEHHGSKHHDTDMTATTLWTFLDQQNNNHKFFLIGIMNRADKIPQQLKSRILPLCIRLVAPSDPAKKRKVFLSKLIDETTALHSECDEKFLDDTLAQLQESTQRDLQCLALKARQIFRMEDRASQVKMIKKRHLGQAIKELEEMRQLLKFDQEEETDEERQERHHKESLALQEQHHHQSIRASLLAQTRQRSQVTGGISGGASLGASGLGGSLGASLSETSAPGMSREDAERTWQEAVPNSGETLFRENEPGNDRARGEEYQSITEKLKKNKKILLIGGAVVGGLLCTIQ